MADITLQTLITESADYVKADLEDDDDSAVIESRLTSAINEAKNIIAQRTRLTTSENVTLDANACFDISALTKTFWGLVSVKVSDGCVILTSEQNGLIWCNASPFGTVAVEYEYIPADMEEITDIYPLPDSISWRLLCYFAAAQFYIIKGTTTSLNKSGFWMNKWTTGLNNLKGGSKMAHRRVNATYNYGDYE